MAILQAILLGIIEGLTEFLPISSTGHLIVAQDVIGYKDVAELFTVGIQLGAIAAVIVYFWRDLLSRLKGLLHGKKADRRFVLNWILATIPAALAGLLLSSQISDVATVGVIAWALLLGGIVILLIEAYHQPKKAKGTPQFDQLTSKQSVQVGLYQIFALIPGVSRSGATIMGGVLSGLDRVTATAFSFYLSIPIIVLAGGYKLVVEYEHIDKISGGAPALLVGALSAFITALFAIKWLLRYVSRHSFKIFAYYRIALGLIILFVLLAQ